MRNDVATDLIEAPTPPARGVGPTRQLFARPSRQGILICAASLMPAYLFALLAWIRVVAIFDLWWSPIPADLNGIGTYWLAMLHHALTAAFLGLTAWLFLIRRPSVETGRSRNWIADVAAVAGSVIVVGLSMAPQTLDHVLVIAGAEALLTAGLAVMVCGLISLGRSFGVMPRARGLVRTGLYRQIRHPIYLGEFLAFGGMLLPTLSPFTVAVYVTFVLLQAYRMSQEEQTLTAAYPEYAEFRATTARLLPGIF
jgi:protein-S-isoprenylcysteine O-methyltransferase Ste14